MFCISDMSSKKKNLDSGTGRPATNTLISDADDEIESGDGYYYPWEKLNDLGFDNLWIDANKQSSPGILRRPSLVRHPSFENVVASKDSSKILSTSQKTSKSSSKLNGASEYELSRTQLDQEKQIQDDYIHFKFGLHRFLIIPDGNCMYRALAQALAHDQNQHSVLRKEVVTFIKQNRQDFEPIIEGYFDDFINQASKNNTWGSYVELLAATKLLSINIVIVTGGCISNPEVSVTCHHYDPNNDSITPKDTVWLSWLSNGHYDVILDSVVKNEQYEQWMEQKCRQLESDAELAEKLSQQDHSEVSCCGSLVDRWQFDSKTKTPLHCLLAKDLNHSALSAPSVVSNESDYTTACSSHSPTQRPWSMEDDEQLARSLQEVEDVFAYYGMS